MKKLSEIKSAVIAYMDQECPNYGEPVRVTKNACIQRSKVRHLEKGDIDTIYFLWDGIGWPINLWFSVTPEWDAPDRWEEAYRVLGLETRRAVEAERAKAARLAEMANTVVTTAREINSTDDTDLNFHLLQTESLAIALAAWKGGGNEH